MSAFYLGAASFLFVNVLVGLWRVVRGPDPSDRLMAAQLFGTTAAAIMLLLAEAEAMEGLRPLALVFSSLAVVAVVAFVRLTGPFDAAEEPREPD
ncbi:MAG: monovalent cation/H+ antiporter complex subunit F [Pseudomonadota bacterium]